MDQGSSRTHSAIGSLVKEGEGSDNGPGSSREISSKRTGKVSSRATMDSNPSSRRPSFEKKAMPIRASFESKAYNLPIIQALTGLNVPAFRLLILPKVKFHSFSLMVLPQPRLQNIKAFCTLTFYLPKYKSIVNLNHPLIHVTVVQIDLTTTTS